MTVGSKAKAGLPIETEAYKKEQSGAVVKGPARVKKADGSELTKTAEGKFAVTKLPDAKAKNSKTTATVKNPRKGAVAKTVAKKSAKKAAKVSDGSGRGRKSAYSGKTIYASKEALAANPRRENTAGHTAMAIVIKAGKSGVSYEDYIAKGGAPNHLAWDIEHGNVTVK